MTTLGPLLEDARVRELVACVGVPYSWGVGAPGDAWPPSACDCSGWAQVALVRLGLMSAAQPDRRSVDLVQCCVKYPAAVARLGDLEFYGTPTINHVMVHLGGGWVIGARGGGSTTRGDAPSAYVDLRRAGYRADVQFTGRLRPEFSR